MTSLLIGLIAGIFGGLVGLGGGVIMIPLMVRCFKFNQHQAHGTSLMALVFTGLSGALTYYLNGSVDVVAALLLAAAAILTARFGALYAHALPEWRLKRAFGFFMIFVSLLLLSKPYLAHLAFLSHPATGWVKVLALLASGALAGFLSGMMGVGGGSIMVPALVLLVGLSQYSAQGSSLLAMVPAGSVGAYTHWRLGNVVTQVLPALIIGILVGTFLGGNLAHLLSEANLRLIFAAVLIWLGSRDIRKAMRLKTSLASTPVSVDGPIIS
ncbi:MAG: sulfite exporter TauE/SafE family protein [Syntrophobacterales bacterium]|nr:sulfite exporter TauE/SafE family protein [Syntrophobacterales bacterium]